MAEDFRLRSVAAAAYGPAALFRLPRAPCCLPTTNPANVCTAWRLVVVGAVLIVAMVCGVLIVQPEVLATLTGVT